MDGFAQFYAMIDAVVCVNGCNYCCGGVKNCHICFEEQRNACAIIKKSKVVNNHFESRTEKCSVVFFMFHWFNGCKRNSILDASFQRCRYVANVECCICEDEWCCTCKQCVVMQVLLVSKKCFIG